MRVPRMSPARRARHAKIALCHWTRRSWTSNKSTPSAPPWPTSASAPPR
ncbi:hypothetical protein X805_30800 [Sphaerotilus natans subsp. natans DSM 6575]|uniref:Uncharacterized protein n=1 Tax=Sphaerotilus natans subsp. natans DSM 6575 TaxID=1286631 RepID=A0A059KJ96_9BURK|nr:hypothetical protein X805_30800 [Sphaerotilus natans subsp. natans DSM 6575]